MQEKSIAENTATDPIIQEKVNTKITATDPIKREKVHTKKTATAAELNHATFDIVNLLCDWSKSVETSPLSEPQRTWLDQQKLLALLDPPFNVPGSASVSSEASSIPRIPVGASVVAIPPRSDASSKLVEGSRLLEPQQPLDQGQLAGPDSPYALRPVSDDSTSSEVSTTSELPMDSTVGNSCHPAELFDLPLDGWRPSTDKASIPMYPTNAPHLPFQASKSLIGEDGKVSFEFDFTVDGAIPPLPCGTNTIEGADFNIVTELIDVTGEKDFNESQNFFSPFHTAVPQAPYHQTDYF
jgi:hypothetical protein